MALHRLGRIVPCLLTALVGLCLVASRAPGVTEVVARAYDPPPTGDGYFQEFAPPVLNAEGQTVFWASLLNTGYVLEAGIYRGESSIGTLTQIARESPAGLLEHGLNDLASRPAINASGEIAFLATYLPPQVSGGADLRSVYEGSGGALSLIASEGANSPDGNGFLGAYFGDPAFNDAGEAAFQNVLTGTSGGSADDNGLFRGDGATLTQIARELPAGPSSGGLTGLGPPAINASGEVVFRATYLQPLLAGGASRRGLYRGSGGAIIPVATEGDAAPIANAFFGGVGGFGDPSFNDAGDVAFFASLVGTGVGPNSDSGIFRSSAGTVARIVREGDTAPDGDGVFSLLHSPRLNASGQTVFSGFLTDTFSTPSRNMGIFSSSGESVTQIARKWAPDPGGIPFLSFGNPEINVFGQVAFLASVLDETFSFVQQGIFLANGIDTIDVARTTSVDHRIAGQLIDELQVADAGVPHGSGRSWFNDEGQVAYLATLSDGRQVVVRYTIPLPKWTLPGSGHWAVNQNWSNGIVPNSFHDAAIDPPASVVVTGPSENSFVKSLSIGAGSGEAVLLLDNGGDLTALQQVTIHDRGRMVVGRRHTLAAETLSNHGVLTGDGFVLAQLANETAGEVRVAAGESLVVMASAPHTNRGTMEVVGGAMEFIGWVHNTESANLAAERRRHVPIPGRSRQRRCRRPGRGNEPRLRRREQYRSHPRFEPLDGDFLRRSREWRDHERRAGLRGRFFQRALGSRRRRRRVGQPRRKDKPWRIHRRDDLRR